VRELDDLRNRLSSFFRLTPINGGKAEEGEVSITQWAPLAVWVGFLVLFGVVDDDGVVISTYLER
jgi:hypothetical protein